MSGDGHRGQDMDLAILILIMGAMAEVKQDIDIATTLTKVIPIRRFVALVRIIITYTPPNIQLLITIRYTPL